MLTRCHRATHRLQACKPVLCSAHTALPLLLALPCSSFHQTEFVRRKWDWTYVYTWTCVCSICLHHCTQAWPKGLPFLAPLIFTSCQHSPVNFCIRAVSEPCYLPQKGKTHMVKTFFSWEGWSFSAVQVAAVKCPAWRHCSKALCLWDTSFLFAVGPASPQIFNASFP